MGELRKDYILDRWVEIVEKRGKRPHEFVQPAGEVKEGTCFFCIGNENLTPPEIARVSGKSGQWNVRVFPNKFAAVQAEGNPAIKGTRYFQSSSSYGYHEIIVETNDHHKQLADLSVPEIVDVLQMYSDRILALSEKKGIKFVTVFKNDGSSAGTSLVHSHSQIIAYNKVPTLIEQELLALSKQHRCSYCEVISEEMKSERKIADVKTIAAFAPYASRFNYEAWIFPKRHVNTITKLDKTELKELAEVLKSILLKLKAMNASYNYYLHYHEDSDFHFHIEIAPRIDTWAGFEYCTDTIINSVPPEIAAKYYRSK